MQNEHQLETTPGPPPEAILTNIAFGALMTQALYVAAKLGIADLVAEGVTSTDELAARTETNSSALYRILRSLASNGIFRETEARNFELTPLADALRTGVSNSMRNAAIFMGESWHWAVWGDMLHSVKTGKPAWAKILSEDVFDYFNQNPEAGEIFNNAMSDMSKGTAMPVVEAYDFSGFETIADIAGGHGFLLAQILRSTPAIKGLLFDVPAVIAGAGGFFREAGVEDRAETVSGDFFEAVPAADAYIMKHIIHDWDDESALRILASIRRAMIGDGRLLVVETVVPEGNGPDYSKLLDLEMLVSPGGLERTEAEFRSLFERAGFSLTRIIPTRSPMFIIEGRPV